MLDELAHRSATRPDAVAIRTGTPTGWIETTWAEFHDDTLRAAAGVRALDPGPRMAVVVDGSAAALATLLGCLLAGVDAVLLEADSSYLADPRSAVSRSGVSVVVGGSGLPYERCRGPIGELPQRTGDVLQLTSGSSGEPRLVRQPMANIRHGGRTYAEAFRWGEEDAILAAVPLAHSFGLVGGLAAALVSGAALWTSQRFNLRTLVTALADGATAMLGTPLVYRLLLPVVRGNTAHPRLRTVLSSGGPLPADVAATVLTGLGTPVRQIYGSTETGLIAYQPESTTPWPSGSAGVPAPGVQVRVDESGQLLVRLPTLFSGYLDGPPPKLTADGFYPTGDEARIDAAHRIYLTGRKDTFVNVGGRKVNPRRVERLLGEHPGVSDVYVYGSETDGEQRVVAAVVLTPGTTVAEVAAFCRRQGLRPYEVPHRFQVLDRLPRGPMGKVDRRRVAEATAGNDDTAAPDRVAVVGLGYVGLTLAVALARAGVPVVGVDADPRVREALAARRTVLFEPGVAEALRELPADRFSVAERLPETPLRAVVICVGTPVEPDTGRPRLRDLHAAVDQVAERIADETLVVVRSTVPVGTSRQVVYAKLRERIAEPLLAMCPERTIQGRALAELASLPQVIGGVDQRSARRAQELFAPLAPDQVVVGTLESAELVKLACNAHTDLIYGFGNELGLLAEALGVDGNEVIAAANLRYPRPDLSRPGFVGGSCLTKDPYLLLHSAEQVGYHPEMVAAARRVNERVPLAAVDRVLKGLAAVGRQPADAKVLVCGMAYKGQPVTDDVRGSAAVDVARSLGPRVGVLAGHDYIVDAARTAGLGYAPVELAAGLADADALILLSDHPGYQRDLTAAVVLGAMRRPAVVFDMWGTLETALSGQPGVDYRRLGRG
ncbi:hypothetical protein Acy02nite_40710 [Actinoplanes cyaneus]|uniref:UDP-glucose/GDP-mannose dehydrogenase C-terminal domain-containing protein n=1 Tax=Actinoplanes cyaneus TaxID=52696 RepID=A0A919IQD1_9ACTN|nr:nucleotide sugar dehydrogenase [Actinoplanes cyaneus]MCW2138232.1 nucleotide sugar dehydrogenase [Actinoplanes cyaneus]GID66190.1 hypothetical protein Acy02nite_40710 [Actinoplanes cyaneus]